MCHFINRLMLLTLCITGYALAMKPRRKYPLDNSDSNNTSRYCIPGHDTCVIINDCWGERQEIIKDENTGEDYSFDNHKQHVTMSWYHVPTGNLIKKIATTPGFWSKGGIIKRINTREVPHVMLISAKKPSSALLLNMDSGNCSSFEKAGNNEDDTYGLSGWQAGISPSLQYIIMFLLNLKPVEMTAIVYHKNEQNNYVIKQRILVNTLHPKLSFSINENYFCIGTTRGSSFYDIQTGEEKEQTKITNLQWSKNSEHLHNNQKLYDKKLQELISMSDKEETHLPDVGVIDKNKPTIRYIINKCNENKLMLYEKSKPEKEDVTSEEEFTQETRLILPEKISHVYATFSLYQDFCFVVPVPVKDSQENNTLYVYDLRTNLLEEIDSNENDYGQEGEWLLSDKGLEKIKDKNSEENEKGETCVTL